MSEDEISLREEARQKGEAYLREVASGGDTYSKKFQCSSCARWNEVQVGKFSPKEVLDVLKYFNEQEKAEKSAGTDGKSHKVLTNLREMSDEELAALYVELGGAA